MKWSAFLCLPLGFFLSSVLPLKFYSICILNVFVCFFLCFEKDIFSSSSSLDDIGHAVLIVDL